MDASFNNIQKPLYILRKSLFIVQIPSTCGVKGSQPGCTGVTILPRGDTGGLRGGSSYSPGAVDADYSLSPPKTICAW